jgi:hypothetical protein
VRLVAAELSARCADIADAMKQGRVVPFIGAGINLCGRVPPIFELGSNLPSGGELAKHLADEFNYPSPSSLDLARVAQFVLATKRNGPLYVALRKVFTNHMKPTILHDVLAKAPKRPRVIVTTNYDDLMEQALDTRTPPAPYDVVWYDAEGKHRGQFFHRKAGETQATLIESPATYSGFDLRNRTVVLKIHGAIDRAPADPDRPQDSFVITEDHYIDYLLRSGSGSFLPSTLAEEIGECHILFVGYGLKDWNMRVLLKRVWQDSRLQWPSWAVQLDIDNVEARLWDDRNVTLIDADLSEFTEKLKEHLA